MSDQFTLKLNSPITEEQWDAITDVDFDHTDSVFFHTKHGKEVTFVKRKKGKWIVEGEFIDCSVCRREKWSRIPYEDLVKRFRFCPNCGADMRGEQ